MKYHKYLFLFSLMLVSCTEETTPKCSIDSEEISYPIIAHSHNDYDQDIPVITALDHGFLSLEVDVAFDGFSLKVSHDEDDLSSKPSFENDYLQRVFTYISDEKLVFLFVDIKNYTQKLLLELNSVLQKYEAMLVSRSTLNDTRNKIKIILSGDIPRKEIAANESNTFLFIDGRFNEESFKIASEINPIISIDARKYTNSNLKNEKLIRKIIAHVHEENKMIRFWSTNDREDVWLKLLDMNVDIVGVDDIEEFYGVMKKNGFVK